MTKKQLVDDFQADELKLISVKIPKRQLRALDELTRQEKYANRSETIRLAIRDLIKQTEGKY